MYNWKCVIYCRVSSWWQLSWWWLNSQLSNCRRHAKLKKREIVKEFQDWWVTWWLLERPWILEMFKFVDEYNHSNPNSRINIFLCDDVDRFARDAKIHLELKIQLEIREMDVKFVNANFEDTPTWKFVELVMAWNAQLFREQNRERVISRQTARLLDWYRPFNPPCWYKTIQAPEWWKLLMIDESKAFILKEWIEGYANWVFSSLPEVWKFRERKWLIIAKKWNKVKPIHRSTVWRILNNILYTWHIEYQIVTRYKDWRIKHSRDIPLREWKHEWIITLETYYKVKERLDWRRPYTKPQQSVNETYPLRWYLICSCCKLKMSSWTSRWNKSTDYYTFNKKCKWEGKWWVMPKVLHPQFKEILNGVKAEKEYIKFQKELLKAETKERWEEDRKNAKKLRAEKRKLEEKESKIIDVIADTDSKITRKKMEDKIEEIAIRINTINSKLDNIESDDDVLDKVMNIAFKIMENPLKYREKWDTDQKRLLLNLLFRKPLEVNRDTQTFWTIDLSPMFLLSEQFNAWVLQDLEVTGVEPVSRRRK